MLNCETFDSSCMEYDESESSELKICVTDLCIPKLEVGESIPSNSNADAISSDEEVTSPIPFIKPYKIKDPNVVLERCDKIWETIQLIKKVQNKKVIDTFTQLTLDKTNSQSYVKYHPVLSNDNTALPNFKFSVKTKKRLFQCITCGKLYTKHVNLRLHAKRVHDIDVAPLRERHPVLYNKVNNVDSESDKEKEKKKGKETEKESTIDGKEGRSLEAPAGASVQSVSLPITEQNAKLKTRTSVLINSSNSNNDSDASTNATEKGIPSRDVRQSGNTSLYPLLKCTLCKRNVKNIKNHLTDYHKIESCDFMLKELERSSILMELKKLDSMCVNNKSLRDCGTVKEHSNVQENLKRKIASVDSLKKTKLNNDNGIQMQDNRVDGKEQCDICLGFYDKKGIGSHLRTHRMRGETKENMHLPGCDDPNSLLHLKSKQSLDSNDTVSKEINKCHSRNKESISCSKKRGMEKSVFKMSLQNVGQTEEEYDGNGNKEDKCQCSCGKLFRTSYSLYLHRKICKLESNNAATTKSNTTESVPCNKQRNYDKESGSGISITIKKKNNSYEIVDKDNENGRKSQSFTDATIIEISDGENRRKSLNVTSPKNTAIRDNENEIRLQNFVHAKNIETVSDAKTASRYRSHTVLQSSNYSEHHSIVKIRRIEEDVDVDIENDLQTKTCDKGTGTVNGTAGINKNENRKIKVEQTEAINSNVISKHFCVCGKKFCNRKAYDIHISKHQTNLALTCGYCKTSCVTMNSWTKHQCPLKIVKKFVDLPMVLNCHYCSDVCHTYKQFDEHINSKHFDPQFPYQCYECTERFTNPTARKVHSSTKHRFSTCSLCKAKFHDNVKSKHEGYHYGLGFPCHICKKTYASRRMKGKHISNTHFKKRVNAYHKIQSPSGENAPYEKILKDINKTAEFEC